MAERMFRVQFRVSRLRPVGRGAVVQVADINKGTNIQTYQSTMSLIMIELTFSEERDNEIVVKELADADSHINRILSYVFNRTYRWEEVPIFKARMN
jgi:hypothetical protein